MVFLHCDYSNNEQGLYTGGWERGLQVLVLSVSVLVKYVVGFGLSWGCWESDGFSPLALGFLGLPVLRGVHSFPFGLISSLWSGDQASIESRGCPDTRTSDFIWAYMKGFYYFLLTFLSNNTILNHTMEWYHSSCCLESLCVVESLMLHVQDLSRPSWDFTCVVFHMFGKNPFIICI